MRVYGPEETRAALEMTTCIEALERAMLALSAGRVSTVPRSFLPTDDRGSHLGIMPAYSSELQLIAIKLITLTPANGATSLPTIQGLVLVMDLETGRPTAAFDAAVFTELRTAAASALATRSLARSDAVSCGIFGAGTQARSHIQAMMAVRPIESFCIWARSPGKAAAFVAEQQAGFAVPLRVGSAREAGACDIVCTVTSAHEPVLAGDWVKEGAHVNLVGAHAATHREADSALIARAALYVDSLASLEYEGGDLRIPLSEGAIERASIRGEIGGVLAGSVPGRSDAHEITVYNSVGLAAQDLYVASALVESLGLQGRFLLPSV